MSLVENKPSQESLRHPETLPAAVVGPENILRILHPYAIDLARKLVGAERSVSFPYLVQVCLFALLTAVSSPQPVSAEAVAQALDNKTPTATSTPTPTVEKTPTPNSPDPTTEFRHGSIFGSAMGKYVFARQEKDFSITIKPSNQALSGKNTLPGLEETLSSESSIVLADLDTYIEELIASDAFISVFPEDIETVQKKVTGYTVELTHLVEQVATDANQKSSLNLAVELEVVISYIDDDKQPQTASFVLVLAGSAQDLLQEKPQVSYTITQKNSEQTVPTVALEELEQIVDLRKEITPKLLEKIIGEESLAYFEARGVDLIEESSAAVPVRISSRMGIVELVSQYDTVSGVGTTAEPKLGQLGFKDPRFGGVTISTPDTEGEGNSAPNTVLTVSAVNGGSELLQLRLPEVVGLTAREAVTVTADELAQVMIFEGLDFVDAPSLEEDTRSALVLVANLYTELNEALQSDLTASEKAVINQLVGSHLVRIEVPTDAELIAVEGYVFSVEQTEKVARISVVAGPYIFTERNRPIPVLTYPAEVNIPVASLVENKLNKVWDENWKVSAFSITSLTIANGVNAMELELKLNGSITMVDTAANMQYHFDGDLPMRLPMMPARGGVMEPIVDAYSFMQVRTESLTAAATPTPELSVDQKLKKTEEVIAADPRAAAVWQLIKELHAVREARAGSKLIIGFNGYDVTLVYNEVINKTGDLEAAIPQFEIGGGFTLLIYTNQEKYEGFYGTVVWTPSEKAGYFVAAQDFEVSQNFTSEVAGVFEKFGVPIVVSGNVGFFTEKIGLQQFALQNPDVTSLTFEEDLAAGRITLPEKIVTPIKATNQEKSLTEPKTPAGKRLFTFVSELQKSATTHDLEGVVTVNGYALATLLNNPYLLDNIDQSDMSLTMAATSVNNLGIWEIMADAAFMFQQGRYHIQVAEGSNYVGAPFDIFYDMEAGIFTYDDGRKTYTLGDKQSN